MYFIDISRYGYGTLFHWGFENIPTKDEVKEKLKALGAGSLRSNQYDEAMVVLRRCGIPPVGETYEAKFPVQDIAMGTITLKEVN